MRDLRPNARVLMVAPQPFFSPRGTPFSVLHRIRALCTSGYKVDLVTYPIGEDVDLPGLRIFRSRPVPFVKHVRIGPSIAKIFLDISLYLSTVSHLKTSRYDVIHTHEEAAFFGKRLADRFGLIHVYDMHSSLPQQLSNFGAFNFPIFRRMFERLEKKTLEDCDGVITICDDLAEVVEGYVPAKPHQMIQNIGDDSQVFTCNDPEDIREKFDLHEKRIALYTGTLEHYQGIDMLIEAIAIVNATHPDLALVVVGGTTEQVSEYRALAKRLRIESSIAFAGTVSPGRIPSFLKAADLIVSPRSRGTNTPLKIYNYLRARKPIVATDMLTHTQTLSSETAVLVPPTAEGLAQGTIRLLEDSHLSMTLAENAQRLAEKEFSDAKYVQSVAAVYDRILGSTSHDSTAVSSPVSGSSTN